MKTRIRICAMLLISALALTGCGSRAQLDEPVETTRTPGPTQPPVEVSRPPQSTATPDPKIEVSIAGTCSNTGEVKSYKLDSELMNGELYVSVYFPPCYDEERAQGYPVLYLLHGQTFDDQMWLDLGAGQAADELIADGQAQPFLMVMPYEEFYYRQPETTNFPQALTDEIIPFVDQTFNTCGERACRALGGISRGASWALRLGLQQWELFGSFGAHSLPTFRGDLGSLPGWLEALPTDDAPRIYLDTGRFDPEVKTAYRVEQVLNEKGFMHEWHLNEGRHNTEYWTVHLREYMQWYAAGWESLE
jgi:enterochelin esterase-like enzyme